MSLSKSEAEAKAETLLRVIKRGRASLREAAILLGKSWSTTKAHVGLGKIKAFEMGKRQYVTLEELQKQGVVLPFVPSLAPLIEHHMTPVDSNADDPEDYYD